MVTLHKKFRDQQEHWYVDKLLIGDAHSDNAYAGTTGAEVVPYETNSIEGSNSVLKRDWDRFLGDIAVANRIIELTPNGIIDKMMEYDEYITSDHIKELRAKMYGDK